MEAYAAYWDYNDMMNFAENYLHYLVKNLFESDEIEYKGNKISFHLPLRKVSYIEELNKALSINILNTSDNDLRKIAMNHGIENAHHLHRWKLIDKLFDELVGKNLIQPTIVKDHPIELSPLAKIHRNYRDRVERFEIYLAGFEIANAFSELNDPIEQRKRLEEQINLRKQLEDKELPSEIDEDFLNALEYGMPPTGGIGFGLDRIAMILLNQSSIRDIIPFPQLRHKNE
jgi:lysyl-tRNA synthetase class 2